MRNFGDIPANDTNWPTNAPGNNTTSLASADVLMSSANTYYDGPSISLAPGVWLIYGACLIKTASISITPIATMKITDGISVLGTSEKSETAALLTIHTIPLHCWTVVTLNAVTTIKISCKGSSANWTLVRYATNENGCARTKISAIQLV